MSDADEEARELLQRRMGVLFKLMFWAFAALLAFVCAEYTIYPEIAAKHRDFVYAGAGLGIIGMAFAWRGLLVRRRMSASALRALDVAYSIATGVCFGATSYAQYDVRPAAYLALIYTGATVFARALIIPSSTRRTAMLSSVTFLPMAGAAAALARTTTQDLPGLAFFLSYVLLSTVPIALATLGSHIIYDLRRQISTAQQVGQYTLEHKLGEGGMGKVYRARHVLLRRPTAVKLLPLDRFSDESLGRFAREAQTLSQLSHPNTVAVFDYGRSADGVFYYAMEYLGGGVDLERLVTRHGKQPCGRVTRILVQVCGALQEAHGRGLIHRDVKPANIILCERGGVPDFAKVVDFGLVKAVETEGGSALSTKSTILGTPHYIAPEAVTDAEHIGPAADLYALGCVGYFLLTGKRVFDGGTPIEICINHVTKPPTPPSQHVSGLPSELDAIIMRCLDKQPTARFDSAADLASALRAVPTTDWNDAAARDWWRIHRRAIDASKDTTAAATRTIQIDLETRDADA